MSELSEDQTDAIRQALLSYMREWSEDNYCAGWLIGLEERTHRLGGTFEHLGRLVGWPKSVDAEDGWETWEQAAARWETDEWKASVYGPQWREILAAHAAGKR